MTYGTSHFDSFDAARRYFRAMGFDAPAVMRKLKAGEIHIGKPRTCRGERVTLNHDEGRYFITEESKP